MRFHIQPDCPFICCSVTQLFSKQFLLHSQLIHTDGLQRQSYPLFFLTCGHNRNVNLITKETRQRHHMILCIEEFHATLLQRLFLLLQMHKLLIKGKSILISARNLRPGHRITVAFIALYAAIDYPEEDVGDEGERQILTTVQTAVGDIDALRRTYKTGQAIAEGIPTVIAGLPNSGKSSLYNALLGREEAIVTDIPGTTRDVLSASADIGGVTLLLSDTAGIRQGSDAVEQIGVQRAKDKLAGAALVLFVLDAGTPLTPDCTDLFEEVCALSVPTVVIFNKSDTGCALSAEEIAAFTARADYTLSLSAKTGDGMEELRRVIAEIAGTDKLDTAHDAIIWDARQEASLSRACDLLNDALCGLTMGDPLDAVCTLCESALAEIRGVDGRAVDEDIIAGIFARFCVGK